MVFDGVADNPNDFDSSPTLPHPFDTSVATGFATFSIRDTVFVAIRNGLSPHESAQGCTRHAFISSEIAPTASGVGRGCVTQQRAPLIDGNVIAWGSRT